MILYAKSTRNAVPCYTTYEGLPESVVISLLTNLGSTDIEFLDEATFNTELAALVQ